MSRSIGKIKRLIDKELYLQRKSMEGVEAKVMKKVNEVLKITAPKGESFWGKIGKIGKIGKVFKRE